MTTQGPIQKAVQETIQKAIGTFPTGFWVLFFGTLIQRSGDFILPFLSLYLTEHRHFNIQSASIIVSAIGIGKFFATWFGGVLNDRWGSKPTMLLSLLGTTFAALLMGWTQSYLAIFISTLIYGFLLAIYGPSSKAAIANMLEGSARVRAYGLIYWAINVGTIIAPVLGAALSSLSYGLLFYANAGVLLIFSLLVWQLFKEPPREKIPLEHSKLSMLSILPRDGLLYIYAVLNIVFAVTWLQGFSTLSLAFKMQGFSNLNYGKVFALNGLVVVLFGLPLNKFLPKYPPNLVMGSSALLIALGLGIHALSSSLWGHALGTVVWTLGEIVNFTLLSSVIAQLAPVHLRGTYQGISGSAMGIGSSLAPLLGGYGLTHWGVSGIFGVTAFLAFGLAIAQFALRPLTEQRIGTRLELG
jgi:MFS family permease